MHCPSRPHMGRIGGHKIDGGSPLLLLAGLCPPQEQGSAPRLCQACCRGGGWSMGEAGRVLGLGAKLSPSSWGRGGEDAAEVSLLPLTWEEPGCLCSARLLILCLSCFKISSLKEAAKDDRPQIRVILLICSSKANPCLYHSECLRSPAPGSSHPAPQQQNHSGQHSEGPETITGNFWAVSPELLVCIEGPCLLLVWLY